jgi:hypothetical protein
MPVASSLRYSGEGEAMNGIPAAANSMPRKLDLALLKSLSTKGMSPMSIGANSDGYCSTGSNGSVVTSLSPTIS